MLENSFGAYKGHWHSGSRFLI